MPDQTDGHDVRYDYMREGEWPERLTCRQPGCRETSLRQQPWMTRADFEGKVRQFFAQHPPRGGVIVSDDDLRQLMTVEQLYSRLKWRQ